MTGELLMTHLNVVRTEFIIIPADTRLRGIIGRGASSLYEL